MSDVYEKGRDYLEKLISEFNTIKKDDFNEAATRFRFIDKILIECLNWEAQNVTPEDNFAGEYTDYILHLFRPIAIVEAKKAGNYFELPAGSKGIYTSIKTICKDNSEFKKAIEQVSGYCQKRGIQIGIVTNGWQIVAFIANRSDSIPPMEGKALVISSLDSFLENYKEVWNSLSRSGFEEEYLLRKLLGDTEKVLPPKLSSSIYSYPGIKNRNPFQNELEIISDLVLEDVIKEKSFEKEFLEDCYCKSGALSNYSLVSKEILTTRYNYLFEVNDRKATLEQVANKKGLSPELVEIFANSLSKRPVLLIGDVGVGKSTFIDYLRFVEAPKVFEKSITFKIDLGAKAILALDIRKAIIAVIKEQLSLNHNVDIEDDDFVRHCYFSELEAFKNNVRVKRLYEIDKNKALEKEIDFLGDKVDDQVSHLKNALVHISKSHKKQIIVFIDNCDQRSDQDQELAFLVAQEFAKDWPMIVFVSLRPETFHRTKRESGALSGYYTKAFTIPPPRIDEVIIKRLEFAQRITNGEIKLSALNNNTSFTKLNYLIDAFLYSLDNNKQLLKFLNNISNENIRKAIELVKKFFGSGHVDTQKIIDICEKTRFYNVPLHELLRAVIYGDNIYYYPYSSEIINLFDVRHYSVKEHFILPLTLGLLHHYDQNRRNHGFVKISEVYSYLQGLGYLPNQVDSSLNFAFSKNLFETSHKGDQLETNNNELLIRATNVGTYHLLFLMNSFPYIDAILVDVPIFNDFFRSTITNITSIEDRLSRAEQFKSYLDKVWTDSGFKETYFNWPQISNELQGELNKIRART